MSASTGTADAAGGTTGARMVMDGADWRAARNAYAAFALLILVNNTANVFSVVRDRAASGHPLAFIEPTIWEGSSAVGWLLFWPIGYLAARLAPPRPSGWLRFVLVHPAASVLFSALHILTMSLIRIGAYELAGGRYTGRLFDFVYEYRKDITGYMILAGLVWLFRALERRPAQPPSLETQRLETPNLDTPVLDIKDGARLIRSPIAEIVAVTSAGNYVEVVLADGRRPLMRSTLAAAATELETHGFVRVHRSWLVNTARVRELTAAGSGDFLVTLDGGVQAPLSRRFPDALRSLRSTAS